MRAGRPGARERPVGGGGPLELEQQPADAAALQVPANQRHDRQGSGRLAPILSRKTPQYTDFMTVLDAERHHEGLLNELIASVESYNPGVDRELIRRAFDFAERRTAARRGARARSSCTIPGRSPRSAPQLHLDEQTIAAALLHDVVEDTETELDELRAEFGQEIAQLVEGVTKLTRMSFQSREQAEAENYRKMIVAMAQDVRVILIKLADRLHNLRTIEYLGKQKQVQKAKEALEVYAPLAHRLGIHKLKWEIEDLAFQILHPRKYAEIKAMVADRRDDARAPGRGGRVDPRGRAREGRHPGGDLGPREALLLDLRQDGQEGPRVQRDLRPHGDARDRRALR